VPSVLITIDGDPIIEDVKGEKFDYVVNTPFFIVKKKKKYFIKGGKFWYVSEDVTKGYEEAKKVPKDVESFANKNLPESELDSASAKLETAPELIVVTKPSELVATDGKPRGDRRNFRGCACADIRFHLQARGRRATHTVGGFRNTVGAVVETEGRCGVGGTQYRHAGTVVETR